jgi:hypothetical protein
VLGQIVPKSSAVVPGTKDADAFAIHKDHVNMVKFASVEDGDFQTVSTVLVLLAQSAPNKIIEKWKQHQRIEGV